jgi:hypothetical protein
MTLDHHDRQRVRSVLVQLQTLSDAQQHTLNALATEARPDLVGAIASASRAVDLFERHARELRELLDHPPRLGSATPRRLVSGCTGGLGGSPGMGVVAA